jgi:hypothetical protein
VFGRNPWLWLCPIRVPYGELGDGVEWSGISGGGGGGGGGGEDGGDDEDGAVRRGDVEMSLDEFL